jgi:hypothetical protein
LAGGQAVRTAGQTARAGAASRIGEADRSAPSRVGIPLIMYFSSNISMRVLCWAIELVSVQVTVPRNSGWRQLLARKVSDLYPILIMIFSEIV